jgi:glycosyltransferase involved in cell wall biosynthesis
MEKPILEKQPLVSFIIDSYNRDRFLAEANDSALDQTYPFVEVIVVDDGSTDNSLNIIANYGNRIIPVLKSNGGQASSLNEGFKASKGKIIFFLDCDDLFYPEKIDKIVNYFIENNLVDLTVIFNNLFEVIDKDGFSMSNKMVSDIFASQEYEWKLLSKFIPDFHFYSFFEEEMNYVSHPDQVYEYARRYRYIPFIGMPTSSISISRAMAEKLFPLPVVDGCKVSADELIVKAASLIGKVYSTKITLTKFRFHDNNNWHYWNGKVMTKEMQELASTQCDKYLNSKLQESGKDPVFSFLNSMQAGGFYRHYFGKDSGNYLLALSFSMIKWHLDSTTLSFFIENFMRGAYYKFLVFIRSIFGNISTEQN